MSQQGTRPDAMAGGGIARAEYRAAVAEFDALWLGKTTDAIRHRMDELLAVIDAVEHAPQRRRRSQQHLPHGEPDAQALITSPA